MPKPKTTTKKAPRHKPAPKPKETAKPEAPQLRRMYKGRELVVDVVDGKYMFEGETYSSLSALAKHIVGYGISGPAFFKTTDKPSESK